MKDDSNRDEAQFAPSPNRITRARAHGMLPYSAQMAAAIQLVGAIAGLTTLVGLIGEGLGEWTREYWGQTVTTTSVQGLVSISGGAKFTVYVLVLLAFFFASYTIN